MDESCFAFFAASTATSVALRLSDILSENAVIVED